MKPIFSPFYEPMIQKEYDIIYVPFTTKLDPLQDQFKQELDKQIKKYIITTKNWLKTREGTEYINTGQESKLKNLQETLQDTHIQTKKLYNLLTNNYRIGRSYAQKSIRKLNKQLDPSDYKSLTNLFAGVKKVINNFEETIREDIKTALLNNWNKTKTQINRILEQIPFHNHSTKITPNTRSEMIARTEMQRSFNNGALQTYSNYGLNIFEIVNYNDIGICETCIDLIANNPYTLEEITSILPVHPNCQCLAVVYRMTQDGTPIEKVENPTIIDMFN